MLARLRCRRVSIFAAHHEAMRFFRRNFSAAARMKQSLQEVEMPGPLPGVLMSCPWIKHGLPEFHFKSKNLWMMFQYENHHKRLFMAEFPAVFENARVTIFWNTLHNIVSWNGARNGRGNYISEKLGTGIICHPGLAVGDHSFFQVQTMLKNPRSDA